MYCHMLDIIDGFQKEDSLPTLFRENKLKWCQLMLKTPILQKFLVSFQDQLTHIMNFELANNGSSLNNYLK